MAFTGTIVSIDHSLHRGLVLPDGQAKAIGFTEGDVLNWNGAYSLYGRRVSFEVVETPTGFAAIHMRLIDLDTNPPAKGFVAKVFKPGSSLAAVIAPFSVLLTAYLFHLFLLLPPFFCYALAVNFITATMFTMVATGPRSNPRDPARVALIALAAFGGAPALLICNLSIRSQVYSEGLLVVLFALIIAQFLIARIYCPELLTPRIWWEHYLILTSDSARPASVR